jgi:hypothetical protein
VIELTRKQLARFFPMPRAILLLIVGGYFVLLWAIGGRSQWHVLGVPNFPLPYGDLRSVTSAWECTRRGIAVMTANPCDPYHRPANFPGIWMIPSHLGLGVGDTVWLGGCLAVIFVLAVFAVLPASARPLDAIVYSAAVCSPAVMLGVERGNVDILLFAFVALAVILHRRSDRLPWGHALLLFAAILKLFPIFAAGALARRRSKRNLISLGVVLAAFAIYCVAIIGELKTIWRVTPQPTEYAYGVRILSEWIGSSHLRVWDAGVIGLVLVAMVVARSRLRLRLEDGDPAARRDLDLFVAGAGVYVLSYALFLSFEYRLAFLLLTVPQLLRWTHERRLRGAIPLAALLATLWFDLRPGANLFGFHSPVALVASSQLILFAGLVGGLIGASLPALSAGPCSTPCRTTSRRA